MLHRIPFLRIVLFFSAGIIARWQWNIPISCVYILIFIALASLALSFVIQKEQQYRFRFLFGVGLACLLFAVAVRITISVQQQSEWKISPENHWYKALLIDEPVAKPKTRMCKIRLLSAEPSIHSAVAGKKAIIYVPTDHLSQTLVAGDCLLFYGQLDPSPPYRKKQSVAATGFIRKNQWIRQTDADAPFSIRLKALSVRRTLLHRLQPIISDPNARSIAGALMFGYQNEVDDTLMQSVRNIGAAHILAISGTHFAILFGMMYFLLTLFISNAPKGRRTKQAVLLPFAWGFAFLTGFPASVVRSVVMLSIWGFGEIFSRRAFNLNTVAVTAFFMLLFHPLYLFDVGCQLSFLSVLSILLLYPRFVRFYRSRNPALRHLWELICVSIAAQIGVLPLTMYYFHQFPTAFLATNIVLLPLSSVLLFLIPASLLLQSLFGNAQWLFYPLNRSLDLFISAIHRLDRFSHHNITDVQLTPWDTFAFFLVILAICFLLIKKRIVYLYLLLILIGFQVIHHAWS
jgi:competence protein ComEC